MHLPASALPGAPNLLIDPAGQAVAAQVFGRRSIPPWSPGPLLVTGGDLVLGTAGAGLRLKEGGSSARMGSAVLVAGTVTVNTTAVTANSRIMLTGQNSSGAHGELSVSARVVGTSFTITSSSGTDTRTVGWIIFEPAP